MASLLRSSRLVYSLIGFSRQTGSLTGKRKKILLKDCRGIFNFNELKIRTAVVAAERQVQQENSLSYEKIIYQLSVDLRRELVSRNDIYNAIEAVKQKGELGNSHLILLLKCCCEVSSTLSEEDRIKMAQNIWKIAEDFGTKFTINHYNALLEVFVINNHKFSPKEFLESLKKANLEANFETYRLLLKAYCLQGDIEGAGSVLNVMKELDLPLSREDFNSLIQGHCEIGNLEKAAEILKIMEDRNITPYSDSYTYLLCGYAKHGRIDKLNKTLEELESKNKFLLDSELLEILYTLAINNHDQHVNGILEKLAKEKGYVRLIVRYVIRLFKERKDSLALELFNTIRKIENNNNNIALSAKCVLDFFAAYREPEELLDICYKLVEEDEIDNAIHYSYKACFQTRDEHLLLSFVEAMKARGIKVKKHYYWPAIIRASKKGNSEIFSILNRILGANLLKDYDSLTNIILRHFKFDSDWKVDFENFMKLGADVEVLTRYLVEMFLTQRKFNEVEYLVSTYPVRMNNFGFLLNKLIRSIGNRTNNVEHFVNILYYLAHDWKNMKLADDEEQSSDQDVERKNFKLFGKAVEILLSSSFSEEVNQNVLEKMLEKKMRLLNSVPVNKSNESTNLEEIINKLTDPNLEFEWDNNLLEKKNNLASVMPESNFMKKVKFSDEYNLKAWIRKLDFASVDDFVSYMLRLADQNQFENAIKMGEHMSVLGKEVQNAGKTRLLYKRFLSKCVQKTKEPALLEKAFDLGIKLGALQTRDYSSVIRSYLRSNNPSAAIEKFCDHALCSGELSGCLELIKELVSLGRTEDVDKIISFVTELTSKEISASFLFSALVTSGNMDKAKEMLKSENVELDRNVIKRQCAIWSKSENSEFFEKVLDVLKDLKNFDRKLFYKILVQKYMEENRMDEVKKLYLQMEQDSSLSVKFINDMADFIKNPNEDFEQFSEITERGTLEAMTARNNKQKLFWHFMEKKDYDQAFTLVMSNEVSGFLAAVLLDALAAEGKVSEVLELLSRSRLGRYSKRAALKFLKAGKIDEYFQFLSHFIAEGKISRFSNFLNIQNLLPSLRKDDAFLKKYKSFALQCLEEANVVEPLISYFVECVKVSDKQKEAENIFEQYNDHFVKVPFQNISNIADVTKESVFYENLLSSEKLKPHFFENLSTIYNKIITLKLKVNESDGALRYLEMAEADGVRERLDKNVITLLNEKRTENKRNIPSENVKKTPD